MGTIPTIPTVAAGTGAAAADFNNLATAVTFWSLTPRCLAVQSVAQSLPNNTYTAVTLDNEIYDVVQSGDTPSHDLSTDNSRIYIRTSGKYEISGQVLFAVNSTGTRSVQVRKNAAGNPASGSQLSVTNNGAIATFATAVSLPVYEDQFTAGDYIEMFAHQNSGAALNTGPSAQAIFLRLRLTGS